MTAAILSRCARVSSGLPVAARDLACDAADAGDADDDAGDCVAAVEEPQAQTKQTSQITTRARRGANSTSGLYHGVPSALCDAVRLGLPLVAARELSVPCTTSS